MTFCLKEDDPLLYRPLDTKRQSLGLGACGAQPKHTEVFDLQRPQVTPFLPTVPTFVVRETDVSQHNGGPSGAPRRQSLGQQMFERWA